MGVLYPVVEIFTSIQGEGYHLGIPATFIRFAGCNLKCPWCDTDWKSPKTGMMSAERIVEYIDPNVSLVVITGGEPFIHDIRDLLKCIRKHYSAEELTICFETNGTMDTTDTKDYDGIWITCSPKPQNDWKISNLCFYNELKYVIDDKITIDKLRTDCNLIWLQPEGYHMQESWKKCYEFAHQKPSAFRVGVQLHKIMEVK